MTPEHKAKLKAARAASQKGNGSNERIAACSLSDEQAQTLRRCPEKYKSGKCSE